MELDNKLIRSLLDETRMGNNSAFKQLFQLTYDRIYALALRLTADSDDAEEITKSAYIETWRNISNIRKDSSFTGWLIGMAVYKSLEKIRSNTGFYEFPEQEKNLRFKYTESDPLVRNIETELFTNLPLWDRISFVLHKIENYTIDEIADLTGKSNSDVLNSLESTANYYLKKFDEIQDKNEFENLITKLPRKIPPDTDLWTDIADQAFSWKQSKVEEKDKEIEKEEQIKLKEQEEREKRKDKKRKKRKSTRPDELVIRKSSRKSKRKIPLKWISVTAFIVILALIYFFILSAPSWKVYKLSGNPKLNSQTIAEPEDLNGGDILTTDQNSQARIEFFDEGEIIVKPDSRLIKRNDDYEFELAYGSVGVNKFNARKFFAVFTPSVTIKDYYMGGEYELVVGKDGNVEVKNIEGWLILQKGVQEVILPQMYYCRAFNDRGIGVPVRMNAGELLKKAVFEFNMSGQPEEAFTAIILNSGKSDAVTLWHLIQKTEASRRAAVFDKLVQLAPLPEGVTREGILSLDKNMLQKWLNEIEYIL